VPGKPADSKLLEALTYANAHLQMPPSGKLADPIIADFERWIAGGAPDPRTETVAAAGPGKRVVGESELAKGRQWWAFQAVRELGIDDKLVASHEVRVRSKLDRFVLAKLAEHGLTPSPEADARTLIRRAYIDLIGLKPTYDEVEAYAADRSPDKYERLVDRLLASPQYGERWARYWLDVVRYAEDNPGNITNPPYPHAWRYRDWVIESLNKDVPYDRFVKLQLAADLMPSTPRSDLRALGIIALGPQDHKDVRLSVDVVGTIQLNDWDERLDAVSRGLLGLSVACARCHDHKFDPIQQKDYYRLLSVFASTQRALRPFFDIDRDTETRFMWVYQRMFDLHYTANLLESDPGSKPEQAARQVKKFRDELAALQSEIAAMSKAHPEIAAYIKTVPYPGEKAPAGPKPVEPWAGREKIAAGGSRSGWRTGAECRRRRRAAEADRPGSAVPELGLRRWRVVQRRRAGLDVLRREAWRAARSPTVQGRKPQHAGRSGAARVPARPGKRTGRISQRLRPARTR
jgi:hypothetical protein